MMFATQATAMKYIGLFESPIPRKMELIMLYAVIKGMPIKPSDFRPKRNVCGTILKIGIPIACQDGLIQIA